jgi:hypothetical protein
LQHPELQIGHFLRKSAKIMPPLVSKSCLLKKIIILCLLLTSPLEMKKRRKIFDIVAVRQVVSGSALNSLEIGKIGGFFATFRVPEQQILYQEQGPDPGLSRKALSSSGGTKR